MRDSSTNAIKLEQAYFYPILTFTQGLKCEKRDEDHMETRPSLWPSIQIVFYKIKQIQFRNVKCFIIIFN